MAQTTKRSYQHTTPFDSGLLSVGSIHRIHYEQYGIRDGKPLVFVHGGPGGSTSIKNTIFFNPSVYRVILFDQRGCGQSLPLGETRENSTQDLVSDMEVLRKHLEIQRWHVFGASWGSSLSVLYAQAHPETVVSLTVRGVAPYPVEIFDWNESFERTSTFFPEMYDELVRDLTEEERKDIAGSYSKRFSCGDPATKLAAFRVMDKWGGVVSRLVPKEDDSDAVMTEAEEKHMVASLQIEYHYRAHDLWLRDMQYGEPEQLEKIKNIPFAIVNGRYDLLCPPYAAWWLHKALPKSKLFIIPDAGHSATEPGTQNTLIEIADEFATLSI